MLPIFFGLCSFAEAQTGPPPLTNAGALAALNKAMPVEEYQVVTGKAVEFVRPALGRPLDTARQENEEEFARYEALAQADLITIQNARDLSQAFGGWEQSFALTQRGVRRLADVELTATGAAIVHPFFGAFVFTIGRNRFQKVVSNEPFSALGDAYRVIQGTLAFIPEPQFKNVWQTEQKFRTLLKYDPFTSEWVFDYSFFGYDTASIDSPFPTDSVPQQLMRLRGAK